MSSLFNRTFFRFTMGFLGILLASFTLALVISHFGEQQSAMAKNARVE